MHLYTLGGYPGEHLDGAWPLPWRAQVLIMSQKREEDDDLPGWALIILCWTWNRGWFVSCGEYRMLSDKYPLEIRFQSPLYPWGV